MRSPSTVAACAALLLLVLPAAAAPAAPAQAADSPFGVWTTKNGDSRIRVAPCGKSACATILWTRQTVLDSQNPNPSLRGRSLVGVDLTRDMTPDGKGGWNGSMYNPQDGKTYSATLRRKGQAQLEVGGCVLGGLICGSEDWSGQPEDTASVSPARR